MPTTNRDRHEPLDLVELSLWLAEVPCTPLYADHGTPELELRAVLAVREP